MQKINDIFMNFKNFRYGVRFQDGEFSGNFCLDESSELYVVERWKKPKDRYGIESNLIIAGLSLQVCVDKDDGPRIFYSIDKKLKYSYN